MKIIKGGLITVLCLAVIACQFPQEWRGIHTVGLLNVRIDNQIKVWDEDQGQFLAPATSLTGKKLAKIKINKAAVRRVFYKGIKESIPREIKRVYQKKHKNLQLSNETAAYIFNNHNIDAVTDVSFSYAVTHHQSKSRWEKVQDQGRYYNDNQHHSWQSQIKRTQASQLSLIGQILIISKDNHILIDEEIKVTQTLDNINVFFSELSSGDTIQSKLQVELMRAWIAELNHLIQHIHNQLFLKHF